MLLIMGDEANFYCGGEDMNKAQRFEEEVKSVLTSSWYFYKASFQELLRIFWVPFLVLAVVNVLSLSYKGDTAVHYALFMFQILVIPWLNAVAILFCYAKTLETDINVNQLYHMAFTYWPSLLFILLVVRGLSYLGLYLFQMGIWLALIPAIWFAIRLILAEIIYVIEKPFILETFQLSLEQTRNKFFLILLCIMIVGIPLMLIKVILLSVFSKLQGSALPFLLVEIISSFLSLFMTIILYRIYMVTVDNRKAV